MEQENSHPGIDAPTLAEELGRNRRHELAHFLRARREVLTPAAVGLPETRRRRVRGLRREEVAEVAGISVAWYTWIEQARDLRLSSETVKRLSLALRLDSSETNHLYRLADLPSSVSLQPRRNYTIEPVMRRLLDNMAPNPAYVLDAHWNLILWNEGAVDLFGDFAMLPEEERNKIRLIFLNDRYRKLFQNWSEVARCAISHFRSDSTDCVEDLNWQALVRKMIAESKEFSSLWEEHHVTAPHHWRKELVHPIHGRQIYDTLDLELSQPARYRIITYIHTKIA